MSQNTDKPKKSPDVIDTAQQDPAVVPPKEGTSSPTKEDEMARREFGRISRREGRPGFYARVKQGNQVVEKYAGMTRTSAKQKLNELRVKLDRKQDFQEACAEVFGGVSKNALSFEAACALFLEFRQGRRRQSTWNGDVRRLRILCRSPFGKKPLLDLQPCDFILWGQKREKEVSGSTINRDFCLSSALFKWAMAMGFVKENPIKRVPKYSEKGRAREVYLTQDEARALVAAADGVMAPFLHAALALGARRGELIRLNWRDVDLDRREVVILPENEKAGRGRVIPMTDDLFDCFKEMRQRRTVAAMDGSDAVFLQKNGERVTETVIKKGFYRALNDCKVIPDDKRDRVVLHSLRHSCASFLVAAGVPLLDVARLLGHSTLSVTMRYAHFSPESGRAAVAKLGIALAIRMVAPAVPQAKAQ